MNSCQDQRQQRSKNTLCQLAALFVSLFLLAACSKAKQINAPEQPGQASTDTWWLQQIEKDSAPLRFTQQQLARKEAPDYSAFSTWELVAIPEPARNALEVRGYKTEMTRLENKLEVQAEFFNADRARRMMFEVRTLFFREDDSLVDYTEWVPQTAAPRQFARYSVLSASPYAAKELIQIKNFTLIDESNN